MAKRHHPYTVHLNVLYIQVWKVSVKQRSLTYFHCDQLGIRIAVCIVFAVYEYYICIVHLILWEFMASRQDYFTLLSHGKQVEGTIGNHLTILSTTWLSHKQSEWGPTYSDTAAEHKLIRSHLLTWQPPILHLNVALFI